MDPPEAVVRRPGPDFSASEGATLLPFTPLHLGPGCVVKAVLGRHFSLAVFAFAQVGMDLEVLVRILRRDEVRHGLSHTYLGAAVLGLVSVVVGRPICRWLLSFWPPAPGRPFLTWLRGDPRIPWPAAVCGAFVGTYSHVLLDSVMHADMGPLTPFTDRNALLSAISLEALHLLCLVAGVVGMIGLAADYVWLRRPASGTP